MKKFRIILFFTLIIIEAIILPLVIKYAENFITVILAVETAVVVNIILFIQYYKKTVTKSRNKDENYNNLLTEKDKMIDQFTARLQSYIDDKDKSINELKKQINYVINNIKPRTEAIPVFCNQLSEVIKQTDEAAASLISSFIEINRNVKKQSDSASSFYSANQSGKNDSIFDENKKVLNNLTVNFGKTTEMIKEISSGIKAITAKLDGIENVIKSIEELQEKTHILSINASIVASHQGGDKGNAFAVVVTEIRKLSNNTKSFVTQIRTIVSTAITESKIILANAENSLKKNMETSDKDNKEIMSLVDKIDGTVTSIGGNFSLLKTMTDNLASNINNVVVSIQFQDITRQKIEHVIEPLEHFYKDFNAVFDNINRIEDFLAQENKFDLEQWITKFYTMENERNIMKKTINKINSRS